MEQRRRVMLVEDSPTQAERLRGLLQADGYEIIHFTSAAGALEYLKSEPIEAIVLDYHLPDMNGDLFCGYLRGNLNTRTLPVMMLTVEGSTGAQMHGLDSGADDYLAKSADADVLRVRLRALLRRAEHISPVLDVEHHFSRTRVLVIDDSPTYLHHIASELQRERYTVETAQTPAEGLDLVSRGTFDCVLVDFDMPQIDGAEVCRRIRQMDVDSEHVVLIMLSSHDDKEFMARGFEAGADDYIAKSADLGVTKARMRALLRRKFLLEENRRILHELKEKELQTMRAQAEEEKARLRATMIDKLDEVNRNLERANRELDQFAYAAAHDLKEPLRMVYSYAELLRRRYGNKLDEEANDYIQYCVEGAKRMDSLIQDLLEYARATMSASSTECSEPVDLNIVVARVLKNLRGAVEESGAEIATGSLPALCVEEIRLKQIFQNLVGNAIKYARAGVPPRVCISASRGDDEWVFAVQDNGIGLSPADSDRIFQAFKRAHNGKYPGTGLGLAICQRIIHHHGGRIWVESELDRGSTFYFTLPAALEKPLR